MVGAWGSERNGHSYVFIAPSRRRAETASIARSTSSVYPSMVWHRAGRIVPIPTTLGLPGACASVERCGPQGSEFT